MPSSYCFHQCQPFYLFDYVMIYLQKAAGHFLLLSPIVSASFLLTPVVHNPSHCLQQDYFQFVLNLTFAGLFLHQNWPGFKFTPTFAARFAAKFSAGFKTRFAGRLFSIILITSFLTLLVLVFFCTKIALDSNIQIDVQQYLHQESHLNCQLY